MSYNNIATPIALNEELIKRVRALTPGQTVLELGSGFTTRLIADNLPNKVNFISLEHSSEWYDDIITRAPELVKFVRHCPLVDCGLAHSPFYNLDGLQLERVALVLLDGPPGGKRWPGAFLLTKFFDKQFVIIADDTQREQYRQGLELLAHAYCRNDEHRKEMLKHNEGWSLLIGELK